MQLNYTAIITGLSTRKKHRGSVKKAQKKASYPHRTAATTVPLLRSHPEGVGQELVVWDLPGANIGKLSHLSNILCFLSQTDMKNAILELSLMYGK